MKDLTMNSRGAVLFKTNSKLKIMNLKIPKLNSGQILVRMRFSSLCKSQIMEIDGMRGHDKYLPHLLGHEGSGEVVKVAKDVKRFKVKDKVIVTWIKTEGKNSNNIKYISKNGIINSGSSTTFSSYSIVSENRLVKKPNFLSFQEASFFGCAIPTGSGIVVNEIKHKKSNKILIIGMGGIGLSAIFGCIEKKVGNLNVLEISNNKIIKFNKKFPSLNINFIKSFDEIRDIFFDYIIDCSGSTKAINKSINYLKNNGKLIFSSHPKKGEKIIIDPHELIKGKRIIGTWGGGIKKKVEFQKLFNIYRKNKVFLNYLIEKQYKLEEINLAIKDFKSGKVARPLIKL